MKVATVLWFTKGQRLFQWKKVCFLKMQSLYSQGKSSSISRFRNHILVQNSKVPWFFKKSEKKFEANCLFLIFNAHFCGIDNKKLNKLPVVYFIVYYVKGLRFPCLDTLFNDAVGEPHILGSSTTTYVIRMI